MHVLGRKMTIYDKVGRRLRREFRSSEVKPHRKRVSSPAVCSKRIERGKEGARSEGESMVHHFQKYRGKGERAV